MSTNSQRRVRVLVRLVPEVYDALKARAEVNMRSVNSEINYCLMTRDPIRVDINQTELTLLKEYRRLCADRQGRVLSQLTVQSMERQE